MAKKTYEIVVRRVTSEVFVLLADSDTDATRQVRDRWENGISGTPVGQDEAWIADVRTWKVG